MVIEQKQPIVAQDEEDKIKRLRTEDLQLVSDCLQQDATAMAEFERRFSQLATAISGRIRLETADKEELLQNLRVALLVGSDSKPPLLSQFRGEGSLSGWLRMVIMRHGLRFRSAQRRFVPQDDELIERLTLDESDPELSYIRGLYLDEFCAAFKAAVKDLASQERNTLRYYVLKGLNVEQIAAIYHVNRSTVVRRIVKIKEHLLQDTQRRLAALIDTDRFQAQSVIKLLANRMEMTLSSVLATDAQPSPPDAPEDHACR